MARVTKPQEKHHLFRMTSDRPGGEMLIVGPPSRAYLWVGQPGVAITFSGRKALAQLRDQLDVILGDLP